MYIAYKNYTTYVILLFIYFILMMVDLIWLMGLVDDNLQKYWLI